MILVHKPAAQKVLTDRLARSWKAATRRMAAKYKRTPTAYLAGTKTFRFSAGLYAHRVIKTALRAAQHDKCAFCESKFAHIDYGDVEHYRPKGGFRQTGGDPLGRPGYYWLAYDWDNLLVSCTLCNQQFKRNLFPLRVQKHRARCHADDLTAERPLLLNPGRVKDDPVKHITFVGGTAVPRNRSRRGAETIRALGLNRSELVERRLAVRTELVELREVYDGLLARLTPPHSPAEQAWLARNHARLTAAKSAAGEYAAMARGVLG